MRKAVVLVAAMWMTTAAVAAGQQGAVTSGSPQARGSAMHAGKRDGQRQAPKAVGRRAGAGHQSGHAAPVAHAEHATHGTHGAHGAHGAHGTTSTKRVKPNARTGHSTSSRHAGGHPAAPTKARGASARHAPALSAQAHAAEPPARAHTGSHTGATHGTTRETAPRMPAKPAVAHPAAHHKLMVEAPAGQPAPPSAKQSRELPPILG